jgi:small ligand-binding sensory domain FIST
MQIASAISTAADTQAIVTDLLGQFKLGTGDHPPDLLILFVTAPLRDSFQTIAAALRTALSAKTTIGCTAESVLAADREIERAPAAAAMLMSLPGVVLDTFHFADEEWPELLNERGTLQNRLEAGDDLRAFLMLGDPFTTPIVQLLDACSTLFPQAPIFGGMASNAQQPGDTIMIIDDQLFTSGLVGVSFAGKVHIDTVVSQGCRPIGETHVITRGHRNVIEELGGKPALQAIQDTITALSDDDRNLLESNGLFIGRVIDEGKGSYGRGDFLVRNLLEVQRESGAIAIGDLVRPGQTVQFHVRDAATAHEDLQLLLEGELQLATAPTGVLLFTCNGRGTRMFARPNHDVETTRSALGPVPVAGFFCAGEFGPVGQHNFIHGQTASLALFRPMDNA